MLYAPKLRYVYEYKIDVDFYEECCKLARAKIEHHKKKLHDRVETIGNIIEDLEVDVSATESQNTKPNAADKNGKSEESSISYAESFCTGKNADFYAIWNGDIPKKNEGGNA